MSNLICSSAFTDNEEMKDLHPRLQFHTGDWLTCHLVIKHCQSKSRYFAKAGDDPDLKIYKQYMINQKCQKQMEAQQAFTKCHVTPHKHLVLPRPKVSRCSLFSIH